MNKLRELKNKGKEFVTRFKNDESGATLLEYIVLAVFIVIAVIVIVRILGRTMSGKFNKINTEISNG